MLDRTMRRKPGELGPDNPEHGLCHVFSQHLAQPPRTILYDFHSVFVEERHKDFVPIRVVFSEPFPVYHSLLPERPQSDTPATQKIFGHHNTLFS
jgi:hypothetical protein